MATDSHAQKSRAGPRLSRRMLVLVGIAIGRCRSRRSALLAATVSFPGAPRRWLHVPAVEPVTGPDHHGRPRGPSIVAGRAGFQSGATGHPDLGRSSLALLHEGVVPGTAHHRVDASPGPRCHDSDMQRWQGRAGCHSHDGSHLLNPTSSLQSRWCVPCSCISVLALSPVPVPRAHYRA